MSRISKTTVDVEELFILVFKSMIFIVIIVLVAKELLGILVRESLAKVGSYIIGLAFLFVVIVSKRVRQEMLSFGKRGRK